MRRPRKKRSRMEDYGALAMVLAVIFYVIAVRYLAADESHKRLVKTALTSLVCSSEAGDRFVFNDGRFATVTRRGALKGDRLTIFYRISPKGREEAGSCELIALETQRVDFRMP